MTFAQKILLGLFFVFIAISSLYEVYDEITDLQNSEETLWHVSAEIFMVLVSFTALVLFTYVILKQQSKQTTLEENLKRVRTQLESSNIKLQDGKKEYLKVIQWQFNEWKLSPSEMEVALLMLKGLTIKEISLGRSTHEKTVRKQASAIYEKSGLSGRHELSAWFFEDLL